MNALEAIGLAEGFVETDSEEKYIEASIVRNNNFHKFLFAL